MMTAVFDKGCDYASDLTDYELMIDSIRYMFAVTMRSITTRLLSELDLTTPVNNAMTRQAV
jgi:hypothetical protein